MKKYVVLRPEKVLVPVEVQANSPEEAFRLVLGGDGEEGNRKNLYLETFDPSEEDPWKVQEAKTYSLQGPEGAISFKEC